MYGTRQKLLVVAGIVAGLMVVAGVAAAVVSGELEVTAGPSVSTVPGAGDVREPDPCTHQPAGGDDDPVTAVVVGTSVSDVSVMETHDRHLVDTVIPTVAAEEGRLIVFGAGADAERQPELIADVRFSAVGDNSDNPEVRNDTATTAKGTVLACLDRALAEIGEGSLRSDPFGAVAVAAQTQPDRLVLLSDAIATTPACNLTMRDLDPQFRSAVLSDCAKGSVDLDGTEVWLLGIGLSATPTSPEPGDLTDLWASYLTASGGRVTLAAQTVAAGPR